MKKFNYYVFITIILAFFAMLLYKAIAFPVVNDETATAIHYSNFSVWEIMMYPDHWPNNHILNTIITKYFIKIFGNEPLVIRLPNLLSFILYAAAIFRINKIVLKGDSIFFVPAALLFISNPYLLDFFGLCRGYGMSSAIATMSVSYLITGYKDSNQKHIWISYVLSILASYANFTLLVFWCAISLLIWFYYFIMSTKQLRQIIKPTVILVTVTLLYLALIANPIIKMHNSNEFQYWTSKGFYRETIYPLIEYSRNGSFMIAGGKSGIIAGLIFLTIAANCIYIFIRFKKSNYRIKSLNQPVFVATMILLATAFINITQCHLLNTPNLHGRTALFFYPLFITVFVSFLGLIPVSKARMAQKIVAFCFAFICIWHVADRFSLNWVREWWFDGNTYEVLDYLEKEYTDKTIKLKTNWFFYNSFAYYNYTGKTPWLELLPYDKSIELNTRADYYYIFADDYKILEPRFKVVLELTDDRWLLEKECSEN
jgi:hypothetical protein